MGKAFRGSILPAIDYLRLHPPPLRVAGADVDDLDFNIIVAGSGKEVEGLSASAAVAGR